MAPEGTSEGQPAAIGPVHLGLDVGSVSIKLVAVTATGEVLREWYVRHHARPAQTVLQVFASAEEAFGRERLGTIAATGAGVSDIARALGAHYVNEVVAQARAVEHLAPTVRTVIEMGGTDSKLIFLARDEASGRVTVEDFAMNTLCAAGTGSFLDQQASRLEVDIEKEFGELALRSEKPPRLAGRCSVFAKSDMIHLQQQATPDYDIIAGLCFALARNLKSNLGKATEFTRPIAFQGGVASNRGVVRAFTELLGLAPGELIIPPYHRSTGALGAILSALEEGVEAPYRGTEVLAAEAAKSLDLGSLSLSPLEFAGDHRARHYLGEPEQPPRAGTKVVGYLGVDVGSLSTNVVIIDAEKRLLAKSYLPTAGRPLEAIKRGLAEVYEKVGDRVEVRGVGSTGSGRYLTGDFVGADVVRNEITSQATASALIDPEVDTIFEIGGQDSKYISLENGVVVDFEMNHACAAGTGSFLEEQAERLGINIVGEFGEAALRSKAPVRLGERCTVFMESDLVHYQQQGASVEALSAGLACSIVYNYLNRVVGHRRIGKRIFFQGGVAANRAVVAAFEKVMGKPVVVPRHHDVTGAIGVAILAMEHQKSRGRDTPTNFRGFDLSQRHYEIETFECAGCPNACEVKKVTLEGEQPLFYGSRCDKYNLKKKESLGTHFPDLFLEREQFLLDGYDAAGSAKAAGSVTAEPRDARRPTVGIPRGLFVHELFPYWRAFFEGLGLTVLLSQPTNKNAIRRGVETVAAESCFPVKVMHGHILELLDAGVDYLFLPSIINMPPEFAGQDTHYVCPYVQTIPYFVQTGIDFSRTKARLLRPIIFFHKGTPSLKKSLIRLGKELGVGRRQVLAAMAGADAAQQRFTRRCGERGREVLAGLRKEDRALVVISRPYNGCDRGMNLDLPKKLRDLGVLAIPLDFLPLTEADISSDWRNMFWEYGQRILAAATLVRQNPLLHAVYITNFACGPDSFLTTFFRRVMGRKPALQLEIDEHSADAGVITRCEAFLDSLANAQAEEDSRPAAPPYVMTQSDARVLWIPHMAEHAHALAAAFRQAGLPAEVLPDSDEESLELGRRYTLGKECLPAIVTTGDMVRMVLRPDFEPDRTAFFMPSGSGPCRFGHYNTLHRLILDELGHPDVPIVSPNQGKSFYDDFRSMKSDPVIPGWLGCAAVDMLYRAFLAARPYELERGATDAWFQRAIALVSAGVEEKRLKEKLRQVVGEYGALKVDRSELKPLIGIVGEIYVRSHEFSNANVVRQLESLGAECDLASFREWMYYINWTRDRDMRIDWDLRGYFLNLLQDQTQRWLERRVARMLAGLRHALTRSSSLAKGGLTRDRGGDGRPLDLLEHPIEQTLAGGNLYLDDTFEGEAILSVGKAVEYYHQSASGIVNVMPFTCMPGTIVTGILKRMRKDHDQIPVLSLAYDGQREASILNRLEAFVHQARQFERKKRTGGTGL
jgi:predicted CoA-substrate-specific enzyme activase